jgi:DNA modification methylase
MNNLDGFLNKIIHGDCLEVLEQVPDESIDLLVTDPPFGVSRRGELLTRPDRKPITLDFGEWDYFDDDKEFADFTESWFKECVRVLKRGAWLYIFFRNERIGLISEILCPKYNVKTRTIYVWVKSNPTPKFRTTNWLSAIELVWVGSKGDSKIKNFLSQKEMFNYMIVPNKSIFGETDHPCEKPKEIISRFIRASSNEGETVLDPFAGSGTVAVVAAELRRNFIAIEKDERYVQIANERLEKTTKQLMLL